jgi:putative Holliday junction resolvase
MKVLAIDFGLRNVGLAIFEGQLVEGYGQIKYKREKELLEKISKVCKKEKFTDLVVGLPAGKLEERVRGFGQRLEKETGIKVSLVEEDFTSKQAVEKMVEAGKPMMRRRKEIDKVAACLILENWLEGR